MQKVIVLQDILNSIVRQEDFSTTTPLHTEPRLPLSILVTFGLIVPPQGISGQCVDRGGGLATGNPDPLTTDTHWNQAHREGSQAKSFKGFGGFRGFCSSSDRFSDPPTSYGPCRFLCEPQGLINVFRFSSLLCAWSLCKLKQVIFSSLSCTTTVIQWLGWNLN